MSSVAGPIKIAILDDYQDVALEMADWSRLDGRATIAVFNDHLTDPDRVVERLLPFEVVGVMRERTPLPRAVPGEPPSATEYGTHGVGLRPHRRLRGLLVQRGNESSAYRWRLPSLVALF